MQITKHMDGKIPVTADADTWGIVELMIRDAGGPFPTVAPLLPLVADLQRQGVSREVVIVANAQMHRRGI
jgi:hypothetical protein